MVGKQWHANHPTVSVDIDIGPRLKAIHLLAAEQKPKSSG